MATTSFENPDILRSIREAGAEVIFTPPYSPEFNPIEQAWSTLKQLIRRAETITRDTFDAAVAQALRFITADHIAAWVKHSGYRFEASV